MKTWSALIPLVPMILAAQAQQAPMGPTRDTSFTVQSTAAKLQKQFPAARIAEPPIPRGVSVHENLVYSRVGRRELHLDILIPPSAPGKTHPAVIMIHGGGWRSGDRSQNIPMARRLAGGGYVAVAVEYRLSPEALYPAAVHDLKAAIRWLRANAAEFHIDTTRIAALGCSAGGQLAALLGTTNNNPAFEGTTGSPAHSSSVQAVVDIDGVLDFNTPDEIGSDPVAAKTKAASLWFGGTIYEKPHLWAEASPTSHVGRTTPPIAFINSALDRFHFGRDSMIQKLNALGIYSEVHTIPNTPHPFWFFEPWFDMTCKYATAFLDRTLKKSRR
jgi:acetyl esterase/lipase